jgi:hypothetical protein
VSDSLVVCNHHAWLHVLPPRPPLPPDFWPSCTLARFGPSGTAQPDSSPAFSCLSEAVPLDPRRSSGTPSVLQGLSRSYIRLKQRVNLVSRPFCVSAFLFNRRPRPSSRLTSSALSRTQCLATSLRTLRLPSARSRKSSLGFFRPRRSCVRLSCFPSTC